VQTDGIRYPVTVTISTANIRLTLPSLQAISDGLTTNENKAVPVAAQSKA